MVFHLLKILIISLYLRYQNLVYLIYVNISQFQSLANLSFSSIEYNIDRFRSLKSNQIISTISTKKNITDMTTLTRTKVQECYLETSPHNFVPVNIIPSDLIKCTHCNTYIHHKELDTHNDIWHLNGKTQGLKASQTPVQRPKVNISAILDEANSDEDMAIRSILSQELPAAELVKKQVFAKPNSTEGKTKTINTNSSHSHIAANLVPDQELVNTESDQFESELMPTSQQRTQRQQVLNFKKNIPISPKSFLFEKKNLQVYNNQKLMQNGWHTNQHIFASKKKVSSDSISDLQKQNESYQIQRLKDVGQSNKNRGLVKIKINTIPREPVFQQKISTLSTSGTQGFRKMFGATCEVDQNKIDSDDNTDEGERVVANAYNFQCPGCHGFYCQTCGSDIPPQYRPVLKNLSSLSSNFNQVNQKVPNVNASSFYASHVFNKSTGKTSRVTGCTNCQ